jgi:hypothetical protein
MAKRKINVGGQEFTAEPIEFESERENWNIYLLHDGTTLKVKTVLAEVLRVDNAWAPNGDPLYVVTSQAVVNTTAPDALKKKS